MLGDLPEVVRTADGNVYRIPPAGPWGSFSWARQASLVANAYRQLGNSGEAEKWADEWERRQAVWNALQRGADYAAVVAQFGADLLTAPFEIAIDVGSAAVQAAKWTPYLVIGAAVILAVVVVPQIARQRGLLK